MRDNGERSERERTQRGSNILRGVSFGEYAPSACAAETWALIESLEEFYLNMTKNPMVHMLVPKKQMVSAAISLFVICHDILRQFFK